LFLLSGGGGKACWVGVKKKQKKNFPPTALSGKKRGPFSKKKKKKFFFSGGPGQPGVFVGRQWGSGTTIKNRRYNKKKKSSFGNCFCPWGFALTKFVFFLSGRRETGGLFRPPKCSGAGKGWENKGGAERATSKKKGGGGANGCVLGGAKTKKKQKKPMGGPLPGQKKGACGAMGGVRWGTWAQPAGLKIVHCGRNIFWGGGRGGGRRATRVLKRGGGFGAKKK